MDAVCREEWSPHTTMTWRDNVGCVHTTCGLDVGGLVGTALLHVVRPMCRPDQWLGALR